jgi:hypothetical protein
VGRDRHQHQRSGSGRTRDGGAVPVCRTGSVEASVEVSRPIRRAARVARSCAEIGTAASDVAETPYVGCSVVDAIADSAERAAVTTSLQRGSDMYV